MNPIKISRRRLLQTTGGMGVLGALGAGWVFTGSTEQYLEGVLENYLDDTPRDPDAIPTCISTFMTKVSVGELGKIEKLVKLSRVLGVAGVSKMLDTWKPYDNFRRRLVTFFLVNSSYFEQASETEPVEFIDRADICGNPFARFN